MIYDKEQFYKDIGEALSSSRIQVTTTIGHVLAHPQFMKLRNVWLYIDVKEGKVHFELVCEVPEDFPEVSDYFMACIILIYAYRTCGICDKQKDSRKCKLYPSKLMKVKNRKMIFKYSSNEERIPFLLLEMCEFMFQSARVANGVMTNAKEEHLKMLAFAEIQDFMNHSGEKHYIPEGMWNVRRLRNLMQEEIDFGNY